MKHTIIVFVFIAQFAHAQTQWTKSTSNLVITKTLNNYEGTAIGSPAVIDQGDTLKMLYAAGGTDSKGRISYAYSLDGKTWTKYNQATPVFDVSSSGNWDSHFIDTPDWLKDQQGYKMYYFGDNDNNAIGGAFGLATSTDGIHWVRSGTQPILMPGNKTDWDGLYIESPSVLYDGTSYFMWYSGVDSTYKVRIGSATSPDGITWTKYAGNPVIDGGSVYSWEGLSVATPTIIKHGNLFEMWYCGASYYDILDNNTIDTIKIGYATSTDGLHWTKHAKNPIMSTYDSPYNNNEKRGPWTPDVIYRQTDNTYYMWYETAYGFGLATDHNSTVAMQYKALPPSFSLYPNPVNDMLVIRFSNNQYNQQLLKIYNVMGILVKKIFVSQDDTININDLPSGLYFVHIESYPEQNQKFIKQ